MKLVALALVATSVLAFAACGDSSSSPYSPPALPNLDGGVDSGSVIDAGADTSIPVADAGKPDVSVSNAPCTTTFRYVPPAGQTYMTVQVTGEWNNFASPGVPMIGPDSSGAYAASVVLPVGLVGYKLLLDGTFVEDPGATLLKFVGGVENSGIQVADCHMPTLALSTESNTRAAAGQGHYTATVAFTDGIGAPALDPSTVKATFRQDQTRTTTSATVDTVHQTISVDVPSLADGKYSVFVDASDLAGQAASTLRLVFWIEAETFDWNDALIYMVMTDRFKDGDPTNDATPTSGVDPREDFQGGDFQGVADAIESGYFDQLGVRALWLSPFHTNPPDPWIASDNVHETMGYHGYWPIHPREAEPRWGGDAALKAMVAAAHAHGIRIIQDFMVGDVHQEHDYVTQHPDWFISGCVCGTANCDWTAQRLQCVFSIYLPRVDWTNPAVSQQWGDDAVWWGDTYDLDGFRIDAVKQVQNIAIVNTSARMRGEFEPSGTKFYLTGETAMGWVDNNLSDNLSQYQTIDEYIGPHELDGQEDFVIYEGVSFQVFAYSWQGLSFADYWTQASGWEYPQGSIMMPFIGSQDTVRFATLATYRGQDTAHSMSIPDDQWTGIAGPPDSLEVYQRERLAMTWLLTIPGAPFMYYGDEYGEWGGVDPNNRVTWRGDSTTLSTNESASLAYTRQLGTAKKSLVALRRGAYVPIFSNDTQLLFARQTTANDVALVAMTMEPAGTTFTTALPAALPVAEGAVLHDSLGGPDVTVSGGTVTITLPAWGAAILAP
jgi:neopullulanase